MKIKSLRMPKIGFLPLYIKLYDESNPGMREIVDKFVSETERKLENNGLCVVSSDICRVRSEFESAVNLFEAEGVDAIVTLHAAYSPSLESAEVLCNTKLPIIVLDTTYNYEFTPYTYSAGMLYNHGIHGVMDMCNMLRRSGKKYSIVAGFIGEENPDSQKVIDELVAYAYACMIKKELSCTRVGLIGSQFEGMGDFRIDFDRMKDELGIEVVEYNDDEGMRRLLDISDEDIENEYKKDSERFNITADRKTYNLSARVGLAVRKWIEEQSLDAFTMNFKAALRNTGFPTMPFAEASIAMGEGKGYAGEGDVLTAAFVSALMKAFGDVTFTECFCPDWKHGSIFLSHMGEYNVSLSNPDRKPEMKEIDFIYCDAENPTAVLAPLREGRAVFVSLNPAPEGKFEIYAAAGQMLYTPFDNNQNYVVSGWFKPDMPLEEFLCDYSQNGGIHHAAMVYGDKDTLMVLEKLKEIF